MPAPRLPTDTVPALLDALVRADPSRPAVTFLDPPSGARVELSRVTLANWVSKTGGLLQDVVEVEPGELVRLDLSAHWLSVVWPLACWSVGAVVVTRGETDDTDDTDDTGADVPVCGDDTDPVAADRLVVVGLGPLGGRSRRPVPAGALDAGAEVLAQPDQLVPYDPPEPSTAATTEHDHAGLLAAARAHAAGLGMVDGTRLATDVGPCSAPGLVTTVLAPLVAGGSLVLVTVPDPAALAPERPDVLAGSLAG